MIEIRRTRDCEGLNRISNEPQNYCWLARHDQPIDWKPASSHCVILTDGGDAFMVLEQTSDRDWQCCTIFGASCRGKRAVETGLAMKAYMFPKWADLVFGSVPLTHRHAQWFYRKLGGEECVVIESGGHVYTPQEGETLLALRA